MCSTFGLDGGAKKLARAQTQIATDSRVAEDNRQQRVNDGVAQIDQTFGQFNDQFYDGRRQAFQTYAAPQLDEQYADARKNLVFALSGAGIRDSSVGATRLGELERDYARRRVEIADQAQGYAQQARSDVEGARSGLVQQVNSTGDAAGASNAAIAQARSLSVAPSFSPLGQVFQNVTAGIANGRAASEDAAYESRRAGARLYSPGAGGSGRVVN